MKQRGLEIPAPKPRRLKLTGPSAHYTAYGNILAALQCRDAEVMLSGPSDTGKTIGMLNKIHRVASYYPRASCVVLRKKLADVYPTVYQTYKNKVLGEEGFASVRVYGGEHPEWIDYANGSRVWIAGLYTQKGEEAAGKVLSSEHDLIYVNQAEQLSLVDWETLVSRTTGRAGNMPWSQLIGDCNPGAPSHWIKSRAKTAHNPDGTLTLFNSEHKDNPDLYDQTTGELTADGPERLARLKSLTGTRYQRLFLGLWAAPEGAIYSVFDDEYGKHRVEAFRIPPSWPRMVGIDPVGAFVSAIWVAYDPRAQVLNVYREYLEPYGVPTRQHVKNIRELSTGETIFWWVCGAPSERQWRTDYTSHGIPVVEPEFGSLWGGIDRVNDLLNEFALVVHDSCPNLLSEIGSYRRVLKNGVPTDSIADKHDYHLLDALRYAIVGPKPEHNAQVIYNPAGVRIA